jgi:hypothetical protein
MRDQAHTANAERECACAPRTVALTGSTDDTAQLVPPCTKCTKYTEYVNYHFNIYLFIYLKFKIKTKTRRHRGAQWHEAALHCALKSV